MLPTALAAHVRVASTLAIGKSVFDEQQCAHDKLSDTSK